MNNDSYTIRRMHPKELELAIEWAAQEGWNPGLHDAECFYAADPQGFFIGLLGDEPISVGSAVCYDANFAFCGLYVVKPEYRNHNYGMQLTQERLRYTGARITGLDGVLNWVDRYAQLGYQRAYLNTRFQLLAPVMDLPSTTAVMPLTEIPFTEIISYDRQLFPAPRINFLRQWLSQPTHIGIGYYADQKIQGYAVMRQAQLGYKIGPLFADNSNIAESLLCHLLARVPGEMVSLDIPEPNQQAIQLAQKWAMQPGFQAIRMYRNGIINLDLNRIYGITSFELG